LYLARIVPRDNIGVTIVIAMIYLAMNTAVDLLYTWLDPLVGQHNDAFGDKFSAFQAGHLYTVAPVHQDQRLPAA